MQNLPTSMEVNIKLRPLEDAKFLDQVLFVFNTHVVMRDLLKEVVRNGRVNQSGHFEIDETLVDKLQLIILQVEGK
jgi:hypothetical protein